MSGRDRGRRPWKSQAGSNKAVTGDPKTRAPDKMRKLTSIDTICVIS